MTAPDPNDFAETEKALNSAATRVRGLWISFLLLTTYLIISIGTVDHSTLLLENPIKLPVLDVELPLIGFFFVAPLLYLLVHSYLLIQTRLLALRAKDYEAILVTQFPNGKEQNQFRQRLDGFVILQILVGPDWDNRPWGLNGVLAFVAWSTMTAIPLLLLLFVQFQFLPYHHEWLTWFHRFCLIVDLVLLWLYWVYLSRGPTINQRFRILGLVLSFFGSGIILATSVFFAGYPGERIYEVTKHGWAVQTLFSGKTDELRGGASGWFSNRIILPDRRFVDWDTLKRLESEETDVANFQSKIEEELKNSRARQWIDLTSTNRPRVTKINSFRGRNLEGAIFDRSDLRRTDFTGANLKQASFVSAQLGFSEFGCANPARTDIDPTTLASASVTGLKCSNLSGTNFGGANLDYSSFKGSYTKNEKTTRNKIDLSGAYFLTAKVRNSTFILANLKGSNFFLADLSGSTFSAAELEDSKLISTKIGKAKFDNSNLQSVNLSGTEGRDVVFNNVSLKFADISDAELPGLNVRRSNLFGANLKNTNSLGSSWSWSKANGASFVETDLRASSFLASNFILADFTGADLSLTLAGYVNLQSARFSKSNWKASYWQNLSLWNASGLAELEEKPAMMMMVHKDRTLADTDITDKYEKFDGEFVEWLIDQETKQAFDSAQHEAVFAELRSAVNKTEADDFATRLMSLAKVNRPKSHANFIVDGICNPSSDPSLVNGIIDGAFNALLEQAPIVARQILNMSEASQCQSIKQASKEVRARLAHFTELDIGELRCIDSETLINECSFNPKKGTTD